MENLKKWVEENQMVAALIVGAIIVICFIMLNKKGVSSFIGKKLKNGKTKKDKSPPVEEKSNTTQEKIGQENDRLAEIINSYDSDE